MNSTAIEVSWQKGEYKTGPTNYSVSAIDDKNNANKYSCSTEGKPTESTPGFRGVPVSQFSGFCEFYFVDY